MRSIWCVMLALVAGACGGESPVSVDAGSGDDDGDGGSQLVYSVDFEGDAPSWPAPWQEAGGVARADVAGGRARLAPALTGYSLARMAVAGAATDVDVTFTVVFDDLPTQGLGFYVRQNGGYLTTSDPHGQGYAVFVEGFRASPGIGVWREVDGDEQQIAVAWDPLAGMQSGVPYRVRFRVAGDGPGATRLRARMWAADDVEPATWHVDVVDTTAVLQDLAGGFAVDAWSSYTADSGDPEVADVHFDELAIVEL